jgi:hypothetical protein
MGFSIFKDYFHSGYLFESKKPLAAVKISLIHSKWRLHGGALVIDRGQL